MHVELYVPIANSIQLRSVMRPKRGQSTFHQCGNIVATAWKDNKVVNVVSTLASPADITSVNRRQKDGTRVAVECPLCVAYTTSIWGA